MCDGDSDCEDNSDEENCEALVCKLSHHVCANDSTICLPSEKLCDGTDDCPDGSDEKLCGGAALHYPQSTGHTTLPTIQCLMNNVFLFPMYVSV